jgi:hypothetical protein
VRASKASWSKGVDRLVADDASILLIAALELSLAAPIVAETEKGRVRRSCPRPMTWPEWETA